jgi:hypothetical protein
LYRRTRVSNNPKSMNATAISFARLIPDWNSLDSVRHAHSTLEADALVFFALLVLFDVLAHFSTEKRRERLLEKIGLCFFAVAVLAEIAAYPYGQRNDRLSEQLIGSLDAKAGSAATSAEKANKEADGVQLKTDALDKRLERASAKLGFIEQQVRIQGPRWLLLDTHKKEFIESLRKFAGQRVTVVKCGRISPPEQEKIEQQLLDLLGKNGAKWAVESPGYVAWEECTNGATSVGGNLVIVSSEAGAIVKEAAEALWNELNKIEISTIHTQATPEGRKLEVAFLGNDSPWEFASKDPTAVILLIGQNPMFDLSGWKKHQKGLVGR